MRKNDTNLGRQSIIWFKIRQITSIPRKFGRINTITALNHSEELSKGA